MKYLKVFNNQADENAWKSSEDYIEPSLSIDKENADDLSFNSKVKFRAEYNLEGLEGDVALTHCGNIFDSLKVNGQESVTGAVEASRVEKHYGAVGTWEDVNIAITSQTQVTEALGTEGILEYCWPVGRALNDLHIEIIGDYSREYIIENYYFAVGLTNLVDYEMEDVIPFAHKSYGNNGGYWYDFRDDGSIFLSWGGSSLYMYNMYFMMGMYTPCIVMGASGSAPIPNFNIKGKIQKGENQEKNFVINSSDFSLDSENNFGSEADRLYMSNAEKMISDMVTEWTISYESTTPNIGLGIQAYTPEENIVSVMSLEDAISNGALKHLGDNKYALTGETLMMGMMGYVISIYFVDMSSLPTSSNGDYINNTSQIISTTHEMKVEHYESVDYTDENICFTSATDMRNCQLVINDYVGFDEMSGYCLLDATNTDTWATDDSTDYRLCLYTNRGQIPAELDALESLGDNVYKFTEEWINIAEPIFAKGGKVLFVRANLYYFLASYYQTTIGGLGSTIINGQYTILTESMSGGAPKDLSVNASVGKVSLVGEVNDYFSTLPKNGFEGCPLEKIIIPDNVNSIGEKCFGNCDRLKKVYMPKGMTKVSDYAFGGNSVKRGDVLNIKSVKNESSLAFADYNVKPSLYE